MNSLRARSALVLREQTPRIAATRLVWTVAILNSSETSEPLSNGRALKYTVKRCINFIFRPKGGFERTPSNPPCLGPDIVERFPLLRGFKPIGKLLKTKKYSNVIHSASFGCQLRDGQNNKLLLDDLHNFGTMVTGIRYRPYPRTIILTLRH